MKTIHLVCAARPNFMKVAPLYHALAKTDWCTPIVVHTGQHSDPAMSDVFLEQFNVPVFHNLGVGNGGSTTHAELTGRTMIAYEEFLGKLPGEPEAIVVVGDVNATMACALVGVKLHIPVVHLEAGLRSFDREMPEEINRVVTDAVSSLHLAPSKDAMNNLFDEGLRDSRHCVGNIMIDAYEMLRPQIDQVKPKPEPYALVTLHRPSNVDNSERFADLIDGLRDLAEVMPVRWPVHPRTFERLYQFDERKWLEGTRVSLCPPTSYINFMALVKGATIVITDSGGVQEETTYLGVPCATVRESTERPVTISHGTNVLIGPGDMAVAAKYALGGDWKSSAPIPLWDGHTAPRVVDVLKQFLGA